MAVGTYGQELCFPREEFFLYESEPRNESK